MRTRTRLLITFAAASSTVSMACAPEQTAEHGQAPHRTGDFQQPVSSERSWQNFDDHEHCVASTSAATVSDAFRLGLSPNYGSIEGSGNYGCWQTGELGLPAYEYDHQRAAGRTYTAQPPYHMLGNGGSLAHSYADGQHVLFSTRTFPRFANYFRPSAGKFAGGFGYIEDVKTKQVWSTYHPLTPKDASFKTSWGMGYARKQVRNGEIEVTEDTFAPVGDDEVLVQRITIKNHGAEDKALNYYSYWDWEPYIVRQYQPGLSQSYAENETYDISVQAGGEALIAAVNGGFGMSPSATGPANIVDPASREAFFSVMGDAFQKYEVAEAAVFGANPKSPQVRDLSKLRAVGAAKPAALPPGQMMFFTQNALTIKRGESRTLYTLYGMARKGQGAGIIAKYKPRRQQLFDETVKSFERKAVKFVPGKANDGWLGREVAWDSYYLNAGVLLEDGFTYSVSAPNGAGRKVHPGRMISQNSVYMLGQGQNIAPRDMAQFLMPMIYSDPKTAREMLGFMFSLLQTDGRLPFGTTGMGSWSAPDMVGFLIPGDLGLWLQLAVVEYLYATRDFDFLKERFKYYKTPDQVVVPLINVPKWDLKQEVSVAEMLEQVADYQITKVGTVTIGNDTLSKMMLSDWADFLAMSGGATKRTAEEGASTFTTALTLATQARMQELVEYVLSRPDTDDVSRTSLKKLQSKLNELKLDELRSGMEKQWRTLDKNGAQLGFYNRAYLYTDDAKDSKPYELGKEHWWAESNAFALLVEPLLMTQDQVTRMINTIRHPELGAMTTLGTNITSRAGAHDHPALAIPGATTWYSLSGALIRGLINYVDVAPEAKALAWDEFRLATLRNHAEQVPDMFYGIISGSDSWETGINTLFTSKEYAPNRPRDTDGELVFGSSWLEDFALPPKEIKPENKDNNGLTPPNDVEHSINNMHSHAHLIYDALSLVGVRATKTGFVIKPVMEVDSGFGWESAVFGVSYEADQIRGKLRPSGSGPVRMTVTLNRALREGGPVVVTSDGGPVASEVRGDVVEFTLDLAQDVETVWSIGVGRN